nr:DciA family protein [Noviherbaspirillum sedimenti]
MFETCSVLNLEAGQMVLAAPNAALASKLKQQLPKLQNFLQQQGWQVNAIRIKVQVGKIHEKSNTSKQIALSNRALTAFAALEDALEPSSRNSGLKAALQAMLSRHQGGG